MSGAACNIASSGRRRRTSLGFVAAGVAVALLLLLDGRFAQPWWRAGLLPFFLFASLCWFQAAART